MRLKLISSLILLCTAGPCLFAQEPDSLALPVLFAADTVAVPVDSVAAAADTVQTPADTIDYDAYWNGVLLDTVVLRPAGKLNNYSMIGFSYGVCFNRMTFNPSHLQESVFNPGYYSLMFTHHEKMFDYLPYFGWQVGVAYGCEGYRFKTNKETGVTYSMDGARELKMHVIEVPFLAQIHVDTRTTKFMADIGIYGGYRLDVERTGPYISDARHYSFDDTDRRWDYGLQGGVGFGFILSPVELHFSVLCRYAWSSLFEPDSMNSKYNKYYYRYAYPFDIMATVGVHLHLSKRYGKTPAMLRQEALDIVFPTDETNGQ